MQRPPSDWPMWLVALIVVALLVAALLVLTGRGQ